MFLYVSEMASLLLREVKAAALIPDWCKWKTWINKVILYILSMSNFTMHFVLLQTYGKAANPDLGCLN